MTPPPWWALVAGGAIDGLAFATLGHWLADWLRSRHAYPKPKQVTQAGEGMTQYRRKPEAIVEAEQFTQQHIEAHLFDRAPLPRGVSMMSAGYHTPQRVVYRSRFTVTTIHGQQADIVAGDWIMPEPDGEHFYPCKPDIFAATYEAIP